MNSIAKTKEKESAIARWLKSPEEGALYFFADDNRYQGGKVALVTRAHFHPPDYHNQDYFETWYRLWDRSLGDFEERVAHDSDSEFRQKSPIRLVLPDGVTLKDFLAQAELDSAKYFMDPDSLLNVIQEQTGAFGADDESDDENPPEDASEDNSESEPGKALALIGGKLSIDDLQRAGMIVAQMRIRTGLIQASIRRRLELFRQTSAQLTSKLNRILKVVGFLEMYTGERQEIVQIRSGFPSSGPIHIRQLVQFMDEESLLVNVGHGKDGVSTEAKIDWYNPSAFDSWLLESPDHLDQVIAELKGIVAIKPSRQKSKRESANERAEEESQRGMTYLLIRNGENLYRVWTDTKLDKTLFPTAQESEDRDKLFKDAERFHDQDKADDMRINMARNMALMQGIIDRAELLSPLPTSERINLNDPETFESGNVVLIRDGENLLDINPIPTYRDWRQEISTRIVRGSRIFLLGIPWDKSNYERYLKERNYSIGMPNAGIYNVDEVLEERYHGESLIIHFAPGGTYWARNPHSIYRHDIVEVARKQRVGIRLYRSEVINYDEIDPDMVLRMVRDRKNRADFVEMVPTFLELRRLRLEELDAETKFVQLLANKEDLPEELLWQSVKWWKEKVISKRPISSDDAKAWRMILPHARKLHAKP